MSSGLYEILNIVNGKRYIGSSVNLSGRLGSHRKELALGTHGNARLQNAWNKYGQTAFTFSVLFLCNREELLANEQHLLDTLSPEYNICMVAGSRLGVKTSPETRAKISAAKKGVRIRGHITSLETRAKLSEARRKRLISQETRAKTAVSMMGHRNALGTKLLPETRAKMSLARMGNKYALGFKHSTETRARMSQAKMGNKYSLGHKNALGRKHPAQESVT